MKKLNSFMEHMEFSGYTFEKVDDPNQETYLGKNKTYGPVMLKSVGNGDGVRLESWWPMNGKSNLERLSFLEMINEMNTSLYVSSMVAMEDAMYGSTLYTGNYNKETFSSILDAYHADISKIYEHKSLANFMEN